MSPDQGRARIEAEILRRKAREEREQGEKAQGTQGKVRGAVQGALAGSIFPGAMAYGEASRTAQESVNRIVQQNVYDAYIDKTEAFKEWRNPALRKRGRDLLQRIINPDTRETIGIQGNEAETLSRLSRPSAETALAKADSRTESISVLSDYIHNTIQNTGKSRHESLIQDKDQLEKLKGVYGEIVRDHPIFKDISADDLVGGNVRSIEGWKRAVDILRDQIADPQSASAGQHIRAEARLANIRHGIASRYIDPAAVVAVKADLDKIKKEIGHAGVSTTNEFMKALAASAKARIPLMAGIGALGGTALAFSRANEYNSARKAATRSSS